MKEVVFQINTCGKCPYYRSNVGSMSLEARYQKCGLTGKELERTWGPIPDFCPLKEAKE